MRCFNVSYRRAVSILFETPIFSGLRRRQEESRDCVPGVERQLDVVDQNIQRRGCEERVRHTTECDKGRPSLKGREHLDRYNVVLSKDTL